ncbi:hypothetical protein K0I73_18085 [Shewanella mesophila]|uniref:hypothetical protein n=1 Tax=Shewanella mesophila TaxID=2864208 RepID=UPI001C65FCE9|nr:hypothetical protein [Shewanella mesophila]QYJ86038.1 hypothetical protein K0I73_18085 [Shewanella mesophila]
MILEPIPFKLVETWFWMAFSCKASAINKAGKVNIETHFGSVKGALDKHPALQQYAHQTNQ